MEISLKYTEAKVKSNTFLVIDLGHIDPLLSFFRIIFCLFFILTTSFCISDPIESQEQSITKLHDVIALMSFLFLEVSLVWNRPGVAKVLEALTEHVQDHQTNVLYSDTLNGYVKGLKRCILVTLTMEFLSFSWAVSTFLIFYSPIAIGQQKCVHLVTGFIWESDYYAYFFVLNLFVSWIIVMTMFQSTLLMISIIMKMKCKIGIICTDLETMDRFIPSTNELVDPSVKTTSHKETRDSDCLVEGLDRPSSSQKNQVMKIPVRESNYQRCTRKRESQKSVRVFTSNIVNQHIEIIMLVKLANTTFCWLAWVMTQSGGIMVAMAIPKIDLNSFSLQAIANLIEAIDLLLAVGVYNVFGQMLINESERLSLALYSCDWTDKPRSMRRGLYIMQMMASRPLRMTIGGIYTLGMETYGNILNTVYSYATLIQGLK